MPRTDRKQAGRRTRRPEELTKSHVTQPGERALDLERAAEVAEHRAIPKPEKRGPKGRARRSAAGQK